MMRITLTDANGSTVGLFDYDAEPHERACNLRWGGLTYRQQSFTEEGGWVYQAVNEPPNTTPGFNSRWLTPVIAESEAKNALLSLVKNQSTDSQSAAASAANPPATTPAPRARRTKK